MILIKVTYDRLLHKCKSTCVIVNIYCIAIANLVEADSYDSYE